MWVGVGLVALRLVRGSMREDARGLASLCRVERARGPHHLLTCVVSRAGGGRRTFGGGRVGAHTGAGG